jgi:hypothetical protein
MIAMPHHKQSAELAALSWPIGFCVSAPSRLLTGYFNFFLATQGATGVGNIVIVFTVTILYMCAHALH